MRMHHPGPLSSAGAKGDAVADDVLGFDVGWRGGALAGADDSAALAAAERDQLARDIAEIERATMALRKAAPALETWSHPPAPTLGKPRPVWLLVGVLWVSTLVTLGAVVAIAALVG